MMRNILRIAASDLKRLSTNVVAIVIIMGLSVIPCLYAWFNVFSNWAPYDEEATSHVSVAIVSNDKGVALGDNSVSVGDIVVDKMKSNNSINWIFSKSDHAALDGVRSGKYYAAFVIDKDFTSDLVSFIGGNVRHPQITYYENEKKNAIAPKITGKVKSTIQSEVNHAFLSAIVGGGLKVAAELGGEDGSGGARQRLQALDDDLTTCANLIDTYITLVDSSESIVKAANEVSKEADLLKENFSSLSSGASSAISAADATVESASELVTINLGDIEDELKAVDTKLGKLFDTADKIAAVSAADVDALTVVIDNLETRYKAMRKQIEGGKVSPSASVQNKADDVESDFKAIKKDLKTLRSYNGKTTKDARTVYDSMKEHIRVCLADVCMLSSEYKNSVSPQLGDSLDSVKKSVEDVKDMLHYGDSSIEQTMGILKSYPDMMSLGKDKLTECRDDVLEMQRELRAMIEKLDSVKNNEQYAKLMTIIREDPTALTEFVTSPVDVKTKGFYPFANNGSAMAPFYSVLSLWFGALILVAIIHTEVAPIEGVEYIKNYEMYFGRYLLFFVIGQIQTFIIVTGILLFVDVDCEHPFLFWFAMSFSSLTYTLLMYSLTFALGAIGEAAAVILMVLQVAGAGGTFPVEVLPRLYQELYRYMPFAYSINAAREAVAGLYGNDYAVYLGGLLVFIVVSLFIGLVLGVPGRKFTAIIEESTEKTGLM